MQELGISGGTATRLLIFIAEWAVKNGIKEAYTDITEKSVMISKMKKN